MTEVEDELRRIDVRPHASEGGGVDLVTFRVVVDGEPASFIDRMKEVLRVVLPVAGEIAPDDPQWATLVPPWFLANHAPKRSAEEAEAELVRWRAMSREEQVQYGLQSRWTLDGWLYWLDDERRPWRFWDLEATDRDTVSLTVAVDGWPFPTGAIEWMCRACGGVASPVA